MTEAILQTALAFKKAGIYPLRVKEDGSKAPWISTWKNLHGLPSDEDIHKTFTHARGVGVLTGRISGNLEMLEFEGRAIDEGLFDEATKRIDTAKLSTLWSKLRNGYSEKTPSGGFHLLYFVSDGSVPGNTKIAERAAQPEEFTKREQEVHATKPEKVFRRTLIETRGDGGFVVTAPTEGALHKNGIPWSKQSGGPASIPSITIKERNKLVEVLKTLDRVPKSKLSRSIRAGVPETEWERATDWADILNPHGWDLDSENNGIQYWRHSGHASGHSATVGAGKTPDRFYVFSTSTEFEEGRYYSKAEAYAVLNNAGDAEGAREALNLRSRKPVVMLVGRDESELIDEIASLMMEANAKDPIWFEYGNGYVEINNGILQDIDKDTVGYLAATCMTFMAPGDEDSDDRIVAPPMRILVGMVVGKRLKLPKLRRISKIPFFTKSGKLWLQPGYCEEAEVYYQPEYNFPADFIPTNPAEGVVTNCVNALRKHIQHFPFDNPSDEAVWWSLVLHPFVREMINGPTPLHIFGAPMPGTGKTLCAQSALTIGHGHGTPQAWPRDQFFEATLMAGLMAGKSYMFFDNVYTIQSGVLDAALTAYPNYSARLLGGNVYREVPNTGAYVISSNNPEVGDEELRRSVLCTLDAKMEDPTERGIDEPIIQNIMDERKKLIAAVLIIVQAWVSQGMPVGKDNLGSFERWSQVMGGICGSIGLPSPVGDRRAMKESMDSVGQSWKLLVQMWAKKMNPDNQSFIIADFLEAKVEKLLSLTTDLELPIRGNTPEARAVSFGKLLSKKHGQIIAGYRVTKFRGKAGVRYRLDQVIQDVDPI